MHVQDMLVLLSGVWVQKSSEQPTVSWYICHLQRILTRGSRYQEQRKLKGLVR